MNQVYAPGMPSVGGVSQSCPTGESSPVSERASVGETAVLPEELSTSGEVPPTGAGSRSLF